MISGRVDTVLSGLQDRSKQSCQRRVRMEHIKASLGGSLTQTATLVTKPLSLPHRLLLALQLWDTAGTELRFRSAENPQLANVEPSKGLRMGTDHTPSIAFRHHLPNSARFSYATEEVLFIFAQLLVQRRGQRPQKGLDTDKTVEAT